MISILYVCHIHNGPSYWVAKYSRCWHCVTQFNVPVKYLIVYIGETRATFDNDELSYSSYCVR